MAVPAYVTLTRNNDQFVVIEGLRDGITNSFVNGATVVGNLYDRRGVAVPFATNISLSYVATSDGDYRGPVSEKFNPPVGSNYTLELVATDSSTVGTFRIPCRVVERTE
jgi:hypothetical protein